MSTRSHVSWVSLPTVSAALVGFDDATAPARADTTGWLMFLR